MQGARRKEIIGWVVVLGMIVLGAVGVRIWKGDRVISNTADGSSLSVSDEHVVEVAAVPVATETIKTEKENLKTYTNPNPKFSVDFPADMSAESYDEGGESTTILFTGPSGSFQVFVSPYDDDDSLSGEDIHRLQPFTQVLEPQIIQLRGVQAVLFFSAVPEIGKTREVWMAKNKYLFSVTTHADHDAWLAHIMTSWRFE